MIFSNDESSLVASSDYFNVILANSMMVLPSWDIRATEKSSKFSLTFLLSLKASRISSMVEKLSFSFPYSYRFLISPLYTFFTSLAYEIVNVSFRTSSISPAWRRVVPSWMMVCKICWGGCSNIY